MVVAGGGSCDCNNIETALSNYFLLHRNGKVFTTKIYKYSVSTSSTGVKMNANENMVAEPSVGKTAGRDDYQQYGLFQHFTCNWHVDENGFNHIDALEGQTGFTKYGKVQVGEVTCGAWFGVEDTTDAVLYHYSDSQTELTPQPMKECVNPDGTISPWMIHAKYIAGDIDGKPYSSKGLAPATAIEGHYSPISYSGMINYMHQHGNHYCGTTCWDLFYRQLMMIIKYGTINSQSIMAGCSNYSYMAINTTAATGVRGVYISKDFASWFIVGSYVSIGDIGNTSTFPGMLSSVLHNKVFSAKITNIHTVDNFRIFIGVDTPDSFDITLTTYITAMPWHSGSTDDVIGSDGSPTSNTSGKEPFKIQGIETMVGGYEILGNTVTNIFNSDEEGQIYNVMVCENASMLSDDSATIIENYKSVEQTEISKNSGYITDVHTDTSFGIMVPYYVDTSTASSSTRFADELYLEESDEENLAWFTLGGYSDMSSAGLWYLTLTELSTTSYMGYAMTTVSPNGTRGNWQSTTQ